MFSSSCLENYARALLTCRGGSAAASTAISGSTRLLSPAAKNSHAACARRGSARARPGAALLRRRNRAYRRVSVRRDRVLKKHIGRIGEVVYFALLCSLMEEESW